MSAFLFIIRKVGSDHMKMEGQVRIPSGCAISAVISREGKKISGDIITNSMKPMHDRSNGLGGGFAGYGIYPDYKDFYALHMFFNSRDTRKTCEAFLKERFEIVQSEIIPTHKIRTDYLEIFCCSPSLCHVFSSIRGKRICCKMCYPDQ